MKAAAVFLSSLFLFCTAATAYFDAPVNILRLPGIACAEAIQFWSPSSTAAHLFSASVNHGDEDLPRLVLADELEENLEPFPDFALFIRRQIEYFRLLQNRDITDLNEDNHERAVILRNWIDRTLANVGPSWARPLRNRGVREVWFQRGFVRGITISLRAYRRYGASIHRLAPMLSEIKFVPEATSEVRSYLRAILGSSHFARISHVDFSGFVGNGNLISSELRHTPHSRQITHLKLVGTSLTRDGVVDLSRLHGKISYLDISANPISLHVLDILAHESTFSDLRHLCIAYGQGTYHSIQEHSLREFLLHRKKIRFLDLSENELDERSLEVIAHQPAVQSLRNLVLDGNLFPVERVFEILGGSDYLGRLRLLSLRRLYNRNNPYMFNERIRQATGLASLRSLTFSAAGADLELAQLFRGAPFHLHSLFIEDIPYFRWEETRRLMRLNAMRKLHTLEFPQFTSLGHPVSQATRNPVPTWRADRELIRKLRSTRPVAQTIP